MNLFIYGTLRDFDLLAAVGGGTFTHATATLPGYAVSPVKDDIVPTIAAVDGGNATGLILFDVAPDALRRFDTYETAWDYTRASVTVTSDGADHPAEVYLPPAGQTAGAGAWSLERWSRDHGRPAVIAAQELFGRDPQPTAAELRAFYPMALKRAWATYRAETGRTAPATLRYDNAPADVEIEHKGQMQGSFFGLQPIKIKHRQFDGTTSASLPREVFRGIDAALVLPYDPVSDRVLLVEQIRMGPALLGDPNPWSLEPVAGMVDAGETPQEAALREAEEEAGLTGMTLEHIASFYPSPGSSTDYFSCYLGLTTLADGHSYTGGLATENEDLRLHPIPFARAMDLATSGEITAGPLLTMLYWLALNRDRLRA